MRLAKLPSMTPQEERIFEKLARGEWCDEFTLEIAMRGVTPPRVIVSKLRRKLIGYEWSVETTPIEGVETNGHKRPVRYRIVSTKQQARAA